MEKAELTEKEDLKPERVRVYFKKPIRDRKLQLFLIIYFGNKKSNFLIWRGSQIVGLDVWLSDWLDLVKNWKVK